MDNVGSENGANVKPMGRIAFQFPHERKAPMEELLCYVQRVDVLGYETIFVPEAWSRDAFTTSGWIAANTRNVRVGTGIVNVFSRTPALIAQSIATLDEISGGRAVLGLGTSGGRVIENWHGMSFERGLQRTRETVEVVRLALAGERVDYDGQIFKLRGFRLGFQPPRTTVPIYIAAMGPKNNKLTGEIADGWMPIWLPFSGFATARAEVEARVDIAPCVMACVTDPPELAFDLIRPHVAYYVGGMGTFYRDAVARFGFAEVAERIHEFWQSGKRKESVQAVTDDLISQLAFAGSASDCRRRLEEFRRNGVDTPVIVIPHGADPNVFMKTLEALAP
jgi:F420-dependent oxidoreductase-like protein